MTLGFVHLLRVGYQRFDILKMSTGLFFFSLMSQLLELPACYIVFNNCFNLYILLLMFGFKTVVL